MPLCPDSNTSCTDIGKWIISLVPGTNIMYICIFLVPIDVVHTQDQTMQMLDGELKNQIKL